jgi:hypothetical protein
MDAILNLLNTYKLADPAAGKLVGEFVNPELQALYDALIERGSQSTLEALKVGGVIEETDIEDLTAAMDTSRLSKIDNVYSNLLDGSYNHLRAFAGKIESLTGQPYVAQVVEQAVVDRILAAGKPIVYETDDDFATIPDWHGKAAYRAEANWILRFVAHASLVTVATPVLGERFARHHRRPVCPSADRLLSWLPPSRGNWLRKDCPFLYEWITDAQGAKRPLQGGPHGNSTGKRRDVGTAGTGVAGSTR